MIAVDAKRRPVTARRPAQRLLARALPVGSAVSAVYAYRQYRANGADHRAAATVVLVSD